MGILGDFTTFSASKWGAAVILGNAINSDPKIRIVFTCPVWSANLGSRLQDKLQNLQVFLMNRILQRFIPFVHQ